MSGKEIARQYKRKISTELKSAGSDYDRLDILRRELREVRERNDYEREAIVKGYLRRYVPKAKIITSFGFPTDRGEYLRAAEEFMNLGMREEAMKYAKKALGGIRARAISQLSKSDRAKAYKILGKGEKAERYLREQVDESLKEVDRLTKEGQYAEAARILEARIYEIEDIGAIEVKRRLEEKKRKIEERMSAAKNTADSLLSRAKSGRYRTTEERIDDALQAAQIYERIDRGWPNYKPMVLTPSGAEDLSHRRRSNEEDENNATVAYAIALALADNPQYEKKVTKILKKSKVGRSVLGNGEEVSKIRKRLESA